MGFFINRGDWVYLENSVCEIWKPLYQFRIFKSQPVFQGIDIGFTAVLFQAAAFFLHFKITLIMTKLFHIECWYLSDKAINVCISGQVSITLSRKLFEKWVDENDENPESDYTYRSYCYHGESMSIEWKVFYESMDLCENALYNYIVIRNSGAEVFNQTEEAIGKIVEEARIQRLN